MPVPKLRKPPLPHDKSLYHCEDDAIIHRVIDLRLRLVFSLTGSQWIATDLRSRDDK